MRYRGIWPNRRPHGLGGSSAIWPNGKEDVASVMGREGEGAKGGKAL